MDCDVLVVGLGPVGLLLAVLLARRGCDVIAIDREPAPPAAPRAAVLDDEALRALQAAGVAEAVEAAGVVLKGAELRLVRERQRILLMRAEPRTANGHPALLGLDQPLLEAQLAAGLGDVARRGLELVALDQDAAGVTARLREAAGGDERVVRAAWLVGCDGAASTVRRLCGVAFAGTTFAQRWLVVDAAVPEAGEPRVTFSGMPSAPAVTLPLTHSMRRWEVMVAPGARPEPHLVRRLIDAGAEPARAAVYTFHARRAARWRTGRVLLAGDAAHVMPPFAGQGLSAGLRDAVNLAWKLADVIRGGAPAALLDTYERERRPHVARMTALTRFVGSLVQPRRPGLARARDAVLSAVAATPAAPWLQSGVLKPRPRPPLLPQPLVVRAGERVLVPLDDVLGDGFARIAREPVADAGVRTLVLGRDVVDPSGALDAWLRRRGLDAALVRPDRHVAASPTVQAWHPT